MEKIKNFFLKQNMTWPKVILLAVASAVLTAGLNFIPALHDTSFQDIAIAPDCWILFAVFIIVNCHKWWEASLKTFVFFLISQPLVYLIQVPFSRLGFGIFQYYEFWFKITLLTLPGAVAAYQVKRRDWLSAAVLCVPAVYLGIMAAEYFWATAANFPNHLLSMLFCLALSVFFALVLLDKKTQRILVIAVTVLVFAVSLYIQKPQDEKILLDEGTWTYTIDDDSIAKIEMKGNDVTVKALKDGIANLVFEDENGNIVEYYITVSGGQAFVQRFEG